MSKDYELALIVDSQLPEEGVEQTIKRYEDLIVEQGATVVNVDQWGVRKLAYDIRKHQQAVYTFYQFQAEPGMLPELDRVCKLDEAVLRHMVVLVEGGLTPDPSDAAEEEAPVDAGDEADKGEEKVEEVDEEEEEEEEEDDDDDEGADQEDIEEDEEEAI